MAYDFKKLDDKIQGALRHFETEVASLRTGRANPALVENIKIEAYGTENQLKNLSAVRVEDAKTLVIEPWDKSLIEAISKGIETSSLGIMPVVQKDFIRVSLPPLTQERRAALIKVLRDNLEETRVSIRKARDEVWKEIQDKERRKEMSEDEKFRLKDQMEERVKKGTEKLEGISKKKEKDISE